MNIRHTIYILAAVALAACSGNDDVWKLASDDHQYLLKKGVLSDVPISFAPVEIADLQWGAEPVSETRGGSVNADEFAADSFGVFCLAKRKLAAGPKTLTWSKPYANDLYNKHLVWVENEMASVKSNGGNQGEMTWSDEHQLQFYPSNFWYTYGFVAYHPWTKHVVFSKSVLKAYIKVDGNDDVIYAVENGPETTFGEKNADVDELSFSKQYYDSIRTRNLSWDGTLPKFEFKHLLTRLDFYFKLENTPTKNIHVDKVEFDNFRCIVILPLAKGEFNQGLIRSYSDTPYILNDTDTVPDKGLARTKTYDGSYLKDDPKFASAFGHFELREKGETPISGIRAGSAYKYNLTSEFKKVGDCIIIPPVKKKYNNSEIELFVTLCDDNGKKFRNSTAITLSAPDQEWAGDTRYKVNITLNAPSGYGSSSAPAMRAPATETTADGVTLWEPKATVSISK